MSKCILLEEAEKLLNDKIEYSHWADKTKIYKEILMEIGSIQTIDLSEIDEMIKELIPKSSFWTSALDSYKMQALQELKQRLLSNNN